MDKVEITVAGNEIAIGLPSVLDLASADGLLAACREAVSLRKKTVFQAGAVERLSTPCAQVLLAAGKAFREAGVPFSLHQPTEALVEGFSDLGLFSILTQWDVTA